MQTNFLKVGINYNDTPQNKQILIDSIPLIEWYSLPCKEDLPFSPGYALTQMLASFGNNSDKVGLTQISLNDRAFFLLALQNNYSKGDIKKVILFCIDNGDKLITPVMTQEFTTI